MSRSRSPIPIVLAPLLSLVLTASVGAEARSDQRAEIERLQDIAEDLYGSAVHEAAVMLDRDRQAAQLAAAIDAVEAAIRHMERPGAEDDPAIVRERLTFFARWIARGGWGFGRDEIPSLLDERAGRYARELVADLRAAEPPPGVWEAVVREVDVPFRPALAAVALASDPNDAEALAALAQDFRDRRLAVALLRTASRAWPLQRADPSEPRRTALAAWLRLQARLAEAAGYPELSPHFLAGACRWLHSRWNLPGSSDPWPACRELAPFGGLPAAVLAELDLLQASLRREAEEIDAETERLRPDQSWLTPIRCRVPGSKPDFETGMQALSSYRGGGHSDRDGDGLSDREERESGTDPDVADSDGDGIDDGHDLLTDMTDAATDTDPDTESILALAVRHALLAGDPGPLHPAADAAETHIRTRLVLGAGMPLEALWASD